MTAFWHAIPIPALLGTSLLVVIVLLLLQTRRLQQRQAEADRTVTALEGQEKMATLGLMMAGIAHELNTPLGAVCCAVGTRQKAVAMIDEAAQALQEPDADADAQLARIAKALRATHGTDSVLQEALTRTNQLVRELRLAGRGEEVEPEAVDVNVLIEGTLLLLQHELKHGITIELDLGEVAPVRGWPGPLGQVLLNLLLNARQALGESGTIRVSTTMAGESVQISVADDGPGLPPGAAEAVFGLGFTTKDADQGTGMGLFIVRKIVARHKGRITAGASASGGAEFTLLLPASRPATTPA